jgi:hypothetical protein
MKQWFKNLFAENSAVSSMRVMSMLCVVSACGMGITAIWRNSNLSEAAVLCGVFLGAGFGAKVAQFKTEKLSEVQKAPEL